MIISIQTNTILLDQYIGLFLYLYKKRPIYWSTILLQSHDMNVCRPTYKILVHGETSFQIDCWRNVALLHVVQLLSLNTDKLIWDCNLVSPHLTSHGVYTIPVITIVLVIVWCHTNNQFTIVVVFLAMRI